MSGVTLPQDGIAPILTGHAATAGGRSARAIELVISGAVTHRIVDGDLLAGVNPVQGNDGDLPVETGIRLATVIDEVRRLIGREGGEIESLLDLHRVPPDLCGELVERLRRDDAAAPDGNKLAGLDKVPSVDGLAAGNVTILDFTFVGKVSRRSVAHETSAYARR